MAAPGAAAVLLYLQSLVVGRLTVSEHWLRAEGVARASPAAAPCIRVITAAGFVVRVTAVVEGEVCGYCLWGSMEGWRDIELAPAQGQRLGGKAALSRATRPGTAGSRSHRTAVRSEPTEASRSSSTELSGPPEHLSTDWVRLRRPTPRTGATQRKTKKCRRPGPRRARAPGARPL